MIAPDSISKSNIDSANRESVRFTKNLENGIVVVVEKEQKNSPNDMDTITMWADLSSNVLDARFNRPLSTTSETVVISRDNATKIRKDAELAIEKDVILTESENNLDKGKIQALIDQQRINLADVEYLDLDYVTKVMKKN